jgi:uncharacterized protein YggE
MLTDEIKRGPLPQIIMILVAVFIFVVIFYFLIAANAKLKETQYIGIGSQQNNTITVSKTGTVYAKPDLATVTVTVTTDAKTASDAINQNRDKSSAVITFLKAQSVQDKDIKTVGYNVYPKYEYGGTVVESSIYPSVRNPKLVGYTATESLQVKIRQMDKIGDITTGAVTAGASNVSSLAFTVENIDTVKAQARNQAIADAKAEAQSIASNLGVKLGRIVGFNESQYNPIYYADMAKSSGTGIAPAAEPVATGENKINDTVTIIYEID